MPSIEDKPRYRRNVAWAVSGLIGPTLGGVAAQAVGDRATFLLLDALTAGTVLWMLRARRRLRSPASTKVEPSDRLTRRRRRR